MKLEEDLYARLGVLVSYVAHYLGPEWLMRKERHQRGYAAVFFTPKSNLEADRRTSRFPRMSDSQGACRRTRKPRVRVDDVAWQMSDACNHTPRKHLNVELSLL